MFLAPSLSEVTFFAIPYIMLALVTFFNCGKTHIDLHVSYHWVCVNLSIFSQQALLTDTVYLTDLQVSFNLFAFMSTKIFINIIGGSRGARPVRTPPICLAS